MESVYARPEGYSSGGRTCKHSAEHDAHLPAYGTISVVSMHLKTQPAQTAPTAGPSESALRSRWHAFAHSVGWMVMLAFLVRVLWIILAHTSRLRTSEDRWGFARHRRRLGYS